MIVNKSLPPHDLETEQRIIGAILVSTVSAALTVDPRHFYDTRHQLIARRARYLATEGRTPDAQTVEGSLRNSEELEKVGGLAYLIECEASCPSAVNLPTWLETLREKSESREVIREAARIMEVAQSNPGEALNAWRTGLESLQVRGLVQKSKEWFRLLSPAQCRGFEPPSGYVLVGDCHVTRGAKFVVGGQPGIGKSRSSVALAIAGATGRDWFGLKVHAKFRTLILQGENGRYRLKKEFAELNDPALDEWIRVSDRPEFGLAFDCPGFRRAFREACEEFKPGVVMLDPWNAIARDDKQKDFRQAFEDIQDSLPKGDSAPALGIIAHTRKCKPEDRRTGRALLAELSGSHALGSVPRCVFIMEAASDDPEDDRIVWSCAKNNDGELGARSPWHRRNGLFAPCLDFDWDEFDGGGGTKRETITEANVAEVFENGRRQRTRKNAVEALMESTSFKHSSCYAALDPQGRFKDHLQLGADGLLSWIP